MKHILIVGGTGMLKGATEHFIEQGNIVSVMARNEEKLLQLREKFPVKRGRIWPIAQDYRDSDKAIQKVKKAARMFVRIDMAILWIHDTGQEFSERVKRLLFLHNPKVKIFQLRGSASKNPLELSQDVWYKKYPDGFREIFLGFKTENGAPARWLTNSEISEGTISAVKKDLATYNIGEVNEWESCAELRPQVF